ncbi:MAG: hypothetical protein JWN07_2361 [Hyphomicrobiales bacterium]|nr:hypothetical protein [Hyphomicrobiales bacterium]
MKKLFSIAFAAAMIAGAAQAQLTDTNMTCAQYLEFVAKMGATPKTGDAAMDKMAADIDAKVATACKASPKAKAMEVIEKTMMGL